MTVKCKRRTRLAGRPQASFGSLFTTVLAPAITAGASVLDGALAKHKANVATSANNNANDVTNSSTSDNTDSNTNNVPQVDTQGIKELNVPNPVEKPLEFKQETVQSDPTKARLGTRVGQRHKCWIGAAIGGLTSIAGSLFNSAAQKKQMRAQQRMQDYNTALQDAQGIAQSLNGSIDAQEAYLKQFRNAARFGKNIKGNITITDGGDAQPISNNTFLLRGGSHEDINETGQTGIGINVGGNQIEAEGGEVAQEKNGTLRIFSAQPILGNGMSPAQAILRGYNKDKVFAAQERFKRNNHLNDDGSKAKYGNEVPKKRLHVNEDGTLTDTLDGSNYHALATNGEDVVITGKANHWKEAGKKDTSSYFDPMGAVTFASAAGAPILNFTPSNIVGSIREGKDYASFMNSFMNNDNGGFFTKNYAEKHPYISFAGNMLSDAVAGGLGNKGIDLVRGRMNYAPYRKLTYKANRLAKRTGLWRLNNNHINYHDYVYNGSSNYADAIARRFPNEYSRRIGSNEQLNQLRNYYKKYAEIDGDFAKTMAEKTLVGFDTKEGDINRLAKIYQDNPEYLTFILDNIYTHPLAQYSVDDFLKRQGHSIRGVHADDLQDATEYLTTTQKGRHLSGGDRLDTDGGLYTSNSNDIADRFKNPETGKSNGYVGTLQYDFNVDKTKPIEDQLYQARSQIYFDPTQSEHGFSHPFTYDYEAKNKLKSLYPNIKAIEANYGRRTGQFLPSNERAYLPSRNARKMEVETPVTLSDVDEYVESKNKRGRWGAGTTSDDLFVSQQINNTTDFIRDARVLLSRVPDREKLRTVINDEERRRINRFNKASRLRGNTRYGIYDFTRNQINDNYPKSVKDYLYDKASTKFYKLKGNIKRSNPIKVLKQTVDDIHQLISPSYRRFRQAGYNSLDEYDNINDYNLMNDIQKYDNFVSDDRNTYNYGDLPFRLGGKVRKLRLGGRAKYAKGGKVKYNNTNNKINNMNKIYFDGRRNVYPKYRIGGRVKAKDGTSISLNSSYSNKDLLSIITEGHPTARKIVDEIFGSAGDRRKFINDLNFLGLGSDDASSIAGASPIFRQPIVSAAKQARYVQEANKARQTANANKARQTASYTEKQANQTEPFIDYLGKELKNVGNKLGINIDYRPTTYTPTNLGFAIDQAARNMTKGANPFLYTNSSTINKTAKNILNGSKKVYTNVKGKVVNPNTYRYSKDARRVRDASGRLIWQPNYKLRPWVKGAAVATGAGLLTGIGAGLSNLETEDEKTQRELNDYGKPISPYIARPNTKQTSNRTRKDTVTQIPDSIRKPIAKKDSVITPVFKQALNKDSVRRDSVKPRYKGNVTKGNYQLHDGESKVINGVKYTRVGNNIINHKTNVAYIYDNNGNYTGQADYSKVGKNFNDAFDAARAAGRKDFIYRAGKYNNYSTAKETDAKKEALNRRIGLKRIAKRYGGIMPPRKRYDNGGTAYSGALSEVDVTGSNRRKFNDWNNYMLNYGLGFNTKPNIAYQTPPQTPQVKTEDEDNILNTPYLGKAPSFNPALQDYIGLGIDTLAAVGSGIINYKSAGKYTIPERAGYISPSKLVTSYNITPQLQEIKRMRDRLSSSAYNNTSSSVAALNRANNYSINSLTELGKVYADKENEETKLLNQDALNQQSVAEKNIANDVAYNTERARILNEYNQRRGNALSVSLSGLAQAYSNFANSAENRYNTRQNTIAMAAGNRDPKVATMALQMGYDFNPEVLAGIYKSTDDKNLQRLVLGKLSTKDRIKYGII